MPKAPKLLEPVVEEEPEPLVEDEPEPALPDLGPYLRFYHSEALRAKTLALLAIIEGAPDPTKHRKALADLVMELTGSGFEYYYLRALDLAKAGFVTKQSAHLGIGSVMRIVGPVVHNIIGSLDKRQMVIVCGHIRGLME